MDRRNALLTFTAGTIITPLSGCLDFAGLRPDRDTDQDSNGIEENSVADNHENDQQTDELNDDSEVDSNTGADDESDANDEVDGDKSLGPDEVEQRDAGEDVLEFGALQIIDYEEQIEEFEYDEQVSYTGAVKNVGDEAYGSVTIEVRVYDEDDDELGSHRDLTPELEGGETWRFEIAPHSRPEEITDHDIAVTGER
ncbi:FxLYD domain-containing protein [Natronococcus sp. A-GB1]|uniref:FxLYD domain-containing protein n=1 Tax=Natronococcus sp. A-GB1 TaxID=3037648 RepID=UPI00241F1C05|nr:FxLYD domain-containing protein [Natronococcus sp. A-GB1]MDG5761686.1 FxLYD domain-containing protein [Natronococcus sp. A-GB1]